MSVWFELARSKRSTPKPVASFGRPSSLPAAGRLSAVKPTNSWADCSRSFDGSGRSRSCHCDCTPTHSFVHPLAVRQALRRSDPRLPGTELFFTTILRNQARPNHTDVPLRSLPKDLCANLGLSKVRRDRGTGHDRCNHHFELFIVYPRLPTCHPWCLQAQ